MRRHTGRFTTALYIFFTKYITRWIVVHLRARKIYTYYWTINEDEGFKRALQDGVLGIITDNPEGLKKYLLSNKKYLPKEELEE